MNYVPNLIIGVIVASSLVGCANLRAPNPLTLGSIETTVKDGPTEFKELQVLSRQQGLMKTQAKTNHIRMQAIRDTALSISARTALAVRGQAINQMMGQQQSYLDQVFNFQGLMIEGGILPPVMLESRNDLSLSDGQNIRVADRTYRIIKQARFVTLPPSWREYLVMDETRPSPPDVSLLPSTSEEKKVWQASVVEGWDNGVVQANQIYEANLARLKRDYQGMVRYRMLLAQNMVSAPQVAQKDLGVTGGGEALSVNDRILTIKALPSLKSNSEEWTPSVNDSY
ncbi:MAG: type IV secretion system DotC family protein [Gammaproteobacteria bacterium]